MKDCTDIYLSLKPKKYKFNSELKGYTDKWQYGLIAQDVEESLNNNGLTIDDTGLILLSKPDDMFNEKLFVDDDIHQIDYNQLHALHIQMIQKHEHEIEALKQEIKELKEIINK